MGVEFFKKFANGCALFSVIIYCQSSITNNEIPDELTEHNYYLCTQAGHINIDMEYADDMSKITSHYNNMRRYEYEKLKMLRKNGLQVNDEKTDRSIDTVITGA